MGIVRTEITLKNAGDLVRVQQGIIKEPEIRQTVVQTVVDTGAMTLAGVHGEEPLGLLL